VTGWLFPEVALDVGCVAAAEAAGGETGFSARSSDPCLLSCSPFFKVAHPQRRNSKNNTRVKTFLIVRLLDNFLS